MWRWIVVFLIVAGAISAMAQEKVQIINPSFEESKAPTPEGRPDWAGGPPGWKVWFSQVAKAAAATVKWEESGGRTGNRCVSLKGCAGSVCVIQNAPVQAGRTYTCSVWAKRNNPKSECTLSIRWAKADKSWESAASVRDTVPQDTDANKWVKIGVPFTAPKDAAYAVIMLTANAQKPNDTCWFDDVEMLALEPGAVAVSSLQWMHPSLRPIGDPVETAHIKWGKPSAIGKIRALFICKEAHSLREPFELAQRLALELDYVIPGHEGKGWFASNNVEIMERLQGNFYDVIIVTASMAPEMLESLAKRCKGIVLVHLPGRLSKTVKAEDVDKGHFISDPLDALPDLVVVNKEGQQTYVPALKTLRCGSLNGTRVAQIAYGTNSWCLTPNVSFDYHLRTGACYWEAYLQLVARAIIWASGKEMPVQLTVNFENGKFHVRAHSAAAFQGQFLATLADQLNSLMPEAASEKVSLEEGKERFWQIELPTLMPTGGVTCFAQVKDAQGHVAGFACARGKSEPPIAIAAIEPARTYYEDGEQAKVIVRIKNAKDKLKVDADLVDAFGRKHARCEAAVVGEAATLSLDTSNRLGAFNWVNVTLLEEKEVLDMARWYILVPLSREEWLNEYQVGTWSAADYVPQYAQPTFHRMMREVEMTEGLQSPAGYLSMLSAGLWPISTEYGRIPGYSPHKAKETIRKPCFSDPEVRQKTADVAREVALKELPYRPLFGYMNDETSLVNPDLDVDVCSCNFCQERYRTWLKEKYASLEELNRDWGSSYQAWEEVGFVTYKDVRGKQSCAPWVMYRSFMDWAWAEGVEWAKKNARQSDPGVMLALANTFGPNPFSGRDYYLLCKANDYWMEYACETRSPMPGGAMRYNFDAVRSFSNKPNHPWVGYRFDDEYIRFAPWWTALHGATGVSPYGALSLAPPTGSWAMIYPALQHTRRGQLYAQEIRPLKTGIGKLLMSSHRAQAPVAILWSQPSMYVAWAMSGQEGYPGAISKKNAYCQYFMSRQAFRHSVLASGRQFDYICEEQIMQGDLKNYRCLALPGAYAISESLARKLEDFVRDGGTLIADGGCGLTNGVGRPYTAGNPMEKLRTFGKGKTVFMNHPAEANAELNALWDSLPQIADVTSDDGTKRPADIELVLFEDGDHRYLGAIHNYMNDDENYPIRLKLPQKAHVYDMRAGKYLGETDAIETDLAPGGCAMYALLPYQVGSLKIQCGGAETGKPCKVECEVQRADGAAVGRHMLHLDVMTPAGALAQHYSRNVIAENGRATIAIPFAFNDPPGEWKIGVRDVATGVNASSTLSLK
jgi:hypothetical protein